MPDDPKALVPRSGPPQAGPRNPAWETGAIFFALLAIWPALLGWLGADLTLPWWLTWGLLIAALVLMIVVFVRRVRRLHTTVNEAPADGGPSSFPGPPLGRHRRRT